MYCLHGLPRYHSCMRFETEGSDVEVRPQPADLVHMTGLLVQPRQSAPHSAKANSTLLSQLQKANLPTTAIIAQRLACHCG
jgi:hypothetical protein